MVVLASKRDKFKISKRRNVDKINMHFDISSLNAFLGLAYKKSAQINRKSLSNLRMLIDRVDLTQYRTREDFLQRFEALNLLLEARLGDNIENDGLLKEYCVQGGVDADIVDKLPMYARISYNDILGLNKKIEERLRFAFIYPYVDDVKDLVTRLESGDYRSPKDLADEFLNIAKDYINETRRVSVMDTSNLISLLDPDFKDKIFTIVENARNPAKTLTTGIQALNAMLAGGFLGSRLYTFLGLPAGFKSGVLLKTAIDIKNYNKNAPTDVPGARKTVLFVTLENTVAETIERAFNMTASEEALKNFTPQQVYDMVMKHGVFKIQGDDDINVVFAYFPGNSIDTDHLYSMISDIEDDGGEVIALILDYIKRIRPALPARDEKEALKNVTDELKVIATHYNIPVITAHQLNRDAASTIDAAIQSNKTDLGRLVGRGNIGSAWEVQENSDVVIALNVEQKLDTGAYYLTFKRTKIRYAESNMEYFNHPFAVGGKIRLLDDVHLEHPISEISLSSDFEGIDLNTKKGKRNAVEREIIEEIKAAAGAEIFDFDKAAKKKKKKDKDKDVA